MKAVCNDACEACDCDAYRASNWMHDAVFSFILRCRFEVVGWVILDALVDAAKSRKFPFLYCPVAPSDAALVPRHSVISPSDVALTPRRVE